MLRVDEIEDHIRCRDVRGLEAAFRALVGYPGEEIIAGADTADLLSSLLVRVSRLLHNDDNDLPSTCMEMLKDAVAGPILTRRHTYAEGVKIVIDNLDFWQTLFERHVTHPRE